MECACPGGISPKRDGASLERRLAPAQMSGGYVPAPTAVSLAQVDGAWKIVTARRSERDAPPLSPYFLPNIFSTASRSRTTIVGLPWGQRCGSRQAMREATSPADSS